MPVVIDIETIGQTPEEIPSRALEHLYRGLARDDVDEEELAQRKKVLEDRFGLDPTTGRIVCIGLLDTDRREETAFFGELETSILTSFWEYLGRVRPERFVTFNGKSFDFPYIRIRSAVLAVGPTMPLPTRRYSTHPHFDVREVLAGYDSRRKGNLDYFCAVFGIPSPKLHLDGSLVAEAFREGRIEEIVRYCLDDCRATAALYERLRPFFEE